MAFDLKKVALVVGVSLTVIIVVCSVQYVFTVRWKQQSNNVVEPGRFSDPSLKFVTVLFRHGNRASEFKCNTDPHKNTFPEGKLELTKKGKQNMYKKGQIFRRLYNGFLSDLYLDSEILVKTTNTSRTFMSAAMVLAGMYPPKGYQKWSDSETVWQPIPIYGDSPDHGTLFNERGKCPVFDSMVIKLHNQSDNLTDKNITALMSYLSEKCGQPITHKNIMKLYDLLLCRIADGLPQLEWIEPYHIETIKSIVINEQSSKMFFENYGFQKIVIGPLLNEIGLIMESRSNNYNRTRKMHLYSGHDISVEMTMSFLGNTIKLPDFGASLHFHLHYDEINEHTIKMFFYDRWDNEEGKEVLIPICGNPCKFKDFKNLLEKNFSEEWAEECQKLES
ncbi:lysosomal acid phosphatase-like [Metopolophium dirhodum]|uniref:lysosomal acid phosphatase-like n=1 Tax=Metopolophium dirhodum TaxID=44670 RepID=UPI0029905AA9|nr:lysosomal acid phosphatase-like [Metopolophium dirhodum]